ncbi:Phosphatidylserine decarboxylase [hydrothermal vent metagenome]|uniref:Phosphatidylserine decarboxylase n=1 Tax=hydrothermal vent metagenome TaxID=652676 RepID=A0A3B0Z750_9ZZZZ
MMNRGSHPYIAREGWLFIGALAVSGFMAKFYFGLLAASPLWLLCIALAYLFRDPGRVIPPAPLGVVSPADGEVLAIERVRDGYLKRDANKISIRMNRFGTYATRAPIEGKILQHWHLPINDGSDNDAVALDRYAMWLQSDENDDVVLVMAVGSQALKPVCYHQTGERIGQGERCGLVRFGGYIEVLLPIDARIKVAVGDTLCAGSDILATLIHEHVSANNSRANDVALGT